MAPRTDTGTTLTLRALNRALLARQMLLARERATPERIIERLAGLQAQVARPPFVGVWTRAEAFERAALIKALTTRRVVRVTGCRATLHLMTAKDYTAMRAALQPAFDKALASILGPSSSALDLPALHAAARAFLGREPATFDALRTHLEPAFPGANIRHLAYAIRLTLPLVQVPVAGTEWGYPAAAAFAPADTWIGKTVAAGPAPADALVLRYLAAFGPAAVTDAQAWSGLPGLGPVFERLRPGLLTFRDERKRELFDVKTAPRPDEGTPAPVRFVPDFDNLVLGHQDRRRVIADEHRSRIATKNLQIAATFLVDGFVAGTWKIERKGRAAALVVTPFGRVDAASKRALQAEGERLLAFSEPDVPDALRAVRFL